MSRFAYEGAPIKDVVRSRALLADRRFLSLWLSQGIGQTAQNALLFSLLVVVLNITNSSIHTSILVFCFILPSIPLGFLVGVILDRVDKEPVLVITNLLRAAGCILFFFFHTDEWVIYGIAIAVATAGLFFSPAVVSLIPAIVSKDKLVPANSLYNFTLTGSQLLGIVFVAPILLKSLGPDGMFLTAAGMFIIAAGFAARVNVWKEKRVPDASEAAKLGGFQAEFRESFRVLVRDRASVVALTQLILSSTLVLLFAILIPRYMRDVLEVPADSAAFVFAPTGIGALIGLRFLSWFTRFGKNRTVVIGLTGIAVCLVLLALVQPIENVWSRGPDQLDPAEILRISALQALVMAFAAPMGFFYALLNSPAQTVLHERAPPEMRGRIFATQVVSANFISLIPLLLVGAITDVLDISIVLILLAALVGAFAFVSETVGRQEERKDREAAEEHERERVHS
ncbi:MAG TPA: MFS transporter [Dehalococcoidia bacterium]|nr:MFS transporter [Dehalococcoidia bacterium]